MNTTKLRRLYYRFRHEYLTLNNVVLAVAFVIVLSWVWGSVGMMQRNYALQKQLDDKAREQKLAELEVQTLQYQQRFYKSMEYQELSARENLGLANPGEKVFTLPPNTPESKKIDETTTPTPTHTLEDPSNMQQWINFLLGGNAQGLEK